jgi:hypothetical protein
MIAAAAPVPGNRVTWEGILRAPGLGEHVAQFYTQAEFLVRGVSQFAGAGSGTTRRSCSSKRLPIATGSSDGSRPRASESTISRRAVS